MQYVPTAANFLETMADLLDNELLPALPPSLQHKARVAANVCRILERQNELEPAAMSTRVHGFEPSSQAQGLP